LNDQYDEGEPAMSIKYLSGLTAKPRTNEANLHIGVILTIVAGALNAGGFLAIGQYTSHMTGMVSTFADQIVLRNFELAMVALVSWLAFVSGAAATAMMVNFQRRRGAYHIYAPPLLLEAVLILLFGSFGGTLERHEFGDVSLAVITLCLAMGLQNALITKISRAEIRTTHVTGLTTDMGIELGKLFYWNRANADDLKSRRIAVVANRGKLRVHSILIGSFVAGGILGALGFKYVGFVSAVPLALALAVIALAPVFHRN
jgi:uncharacterized membrane protein YoaK (UPF0700 family)